MAASECWQKLSLAHLKQPCKREPGVTQNLLVEQALCYIPGALLRQEMPRSQNRKQSTQNSYEQMTGKAWTSQIMKGLGTSPVVLQ